jgi:peptidoglycan/LPS O-acetylase OafA/YrhL
MDYRKEIDGLRAIAVLPVILFHAGFELFSGGFVGVDVFFVISGYLITTIILAEIEQGKFSIADFYERRARRILPALFFVIFASLPFAWIWLLPSDMKEFSRSLVSVSVFSSNIFFWRESGYFDTAAEFKPLLHTWSLAVEEQYYVIFPLLLMLLWRFGRRWVWISLCFILLSSLFAAQWAVFEKPASAFFLLPMRGWELLVGALAAFYLSRPGRQEFGSGVREAGGVAGILLITYAIFFYSESTPFPGFYALVPVLGAVMIILFVNQQTKVGRFIANKVFVGVGLISYSAYLWHQPIFAFARHGSLSEPSEFVFSGLTVATLVIAYVSWRYIEAPFRNKHIFDRKTVFIMAITGSIFFISVGVVGKKTQGFSMRFDELTTPGPWSPSIKCHGKESISGYGRPLDECLGAAANGASGDIFLIGDSHAAQIVFPLRIIAEERKIDIGFINTEDEKDFPYSFFSSDYSEEDVIFNHILKVSDKGDVVVIAFHRGRFNDSRDSHLPLAVPVGENDKYRVFVDKIAVEISRLSDAGRKVVLVKDAPLLSDTSSIEKCAYYSGNNRDGNNFCSVSLAQDLHTRKRQSDAFDYLARRFPGDVSVVDVAPELYGGKKEFNPINRDGSYRMFDRHHLTESEAKRLTALFRDSI